VNKTSLSIQVNKTPIHKTYKTSISLLNECHKQQEMYKKLVYLAQYHIYCQLHGITFAQ